MKRTGFSITALCTAPGLLLGLALLLSQGACGQRGPLYLPENAPADDRVEEGSDAGESEKETEKESDENNEETP